MNPRFVLVATLVVVTAVLSVVGFLAGQVTGVLAPLAVLAVALWMLRRLHAGGRWRNRIREKDDLVFLSVCRSGVWSVARRLYRRLPSDPRCRLCLVPFGGVGRVLGVTPSRKNPNFCPS